MEFGIAKYTQDNVYEKLVFVNALEVHLKASFADSNYGHSVNEVLFGLQCLPDDAFVYSKELQERRDLGLPYGMSYSKRKKLILMRIPVNHTAVFETSDDSEIKNLVLKAFELSIAGFEELNVKDFNYKAFCVDLVRFSKDWIQASLIEKRD